MFYIIIYLYYYLIVIFTKKRFYKSNCEKQSKSFILFKATLKNRKKPDWIKNEIIKIKAINPNLSCRLIANIFNFKYNKYYIGKTFVSYTLKNHQYEILELRKKFKNRLPLYIKFNQTWGVDLTFLNQNPILGVIEHNSRKILSLISLKDKTSISILKAILNILEQNPKPKYIRTDNEKCFNSKLLKLSLWFLGIKHQTTNISSPWENGKIERFFKTFKDTISSLDYKKDDIVYLCYSFEFWYNNIRFHQNLDYKTPESVYQINIKNLYKEILKE